MKLLIVISLFLVIVLVGCSSQPAEVTVTDAEVEAVAQPTAEQIDSDLDTAQLDEIDADLDLLILE